MDARVLMTVEEYLHTQFDGPDREYVDGKVVERNRGELPHAILQTELVYLLRHLAKTLGLRVVTEIRIQVSPTRFRVADVAVWRAGPIGQRIPTVVPFLVAEILSPEDRLVRLQPKIQEYLAHGVEWVWVIDPDERFATGLQTRDQRTSALDEKMPRRWTGFVRSCLPASMPWTRVHGHHGMSGVLSGCLDDRRGRIVGVGERRLSR